MCASRLSLLCTIPLTTQTPAKNKIKEPWAAITLGPRLTLFRQSLRAGLDWADSADAIMIIRVGRRHKGWRGRNRAQTCATRRFADRHDASRGAIGGMYGCVI